MSPSPRVAIICSAHGLGHLTRPLALAEGLRAEGASPVVFSAAPSLARAYLPWLDVVPWTVDVGIAPSDRPGEGVPATLAALEERCGERAISRLAASLAPCELAVVDTAPSALEAARRAGVPALAVGNFDWAWVYRHFPPLASWADRFEGWQAPHPAISLSPGPGLTGFARVEAWGVLGRRRPAWTPPWPERTVLVALGPDWLTRLRLPVIPGLRWLTGPPEGASYPAVVAGVDLVLTKPGYGIFSECALAGTPMVWLRRPDFPEAPFLEEAMAARGDLPVHGGPEDADAFAQALAGTVELRLRGPRPEPVAGVDPRALARRVLGNLAPAE
jgi:hypothetical protein